MSARVMVMAGGTGGHVFPALAVAGELRARGHEVIWLGVPSGFEAQVVPEHGFPIEWVDIKGLRGKGLAGWLIAPFRLLRACWQAYRVISRRRPELVLGMGGYVTGPGGLVAWLTRRPLLIQEQNAIPGLTNRLLAPLAQRVCEAFPGSFAPGRGAWVTGNPVRPEICALPSPGERQVGRHGPLRVMVLGGSLGAQALNEQLPQAVALIPSSLRPQVRHQAGRGRAESTAEAYRAAGVDAEVTEFVNDMAAAYAWADLVVCRSGALTVSELAAAGVGAILVPFPFAVDDHQTRNGEFLARAGAARLIQQRDLTPKGLAGMIAGLADDRGEVLRMAEAARSLAYPTATDRVADLCEELIGG